MDKVYFEQHLEGTEESPLAVQTVGSFSEHSLAKIKQALTMQWLQTTKSATGQSAIVEPNVFESTVESGYQVQRYLDFIQLAFDDLDYALVREFLHLPKINFKQPASLDCNCEEHQSKRNSQTPPLYYPRNFLSRTWLKMIDSAKKLDVEGDPTQILENLSKASRALGYQRKHLFLLSS
jgi:hypothetical protein